MQKEFGINLPKRSNHAGIVFIRDFLIIIFIKKCIIKVWQIIAILLNCPLCQGHFELV